MNKKPKNVNEDDIEEYLDDYRANNDPDHKPCFNTLNVIKNAILCYYNRVLKKKFIVSIYVKHIRVYHYLLKED